jgi:hypothetical protein
MFKPQGIVRPLGMALAITLGFGTVLGLVVGWGMTIWDGLQSKHYINDSLLVGADGTPLIHRYHTYNAYYQKETFHALDGGEVPNPKENRHFLQGASLPIARHNINSSRLLSIAGRFSDEETPPTVWYFVTSESRASRSYFVGYNTESKLCVGYIGKSGMRPDMPPVDERFSLDADKLAGGTAFARRYYDVPYPYYFGNVDRPGDIPSWKAIMVSPNGLLKVDLRMGSVTTMMESADLIAAGILEATETAKLAKEREPDKQPHQLLAVRTPDQVLVIDASGKRHSAYAIPEGLRDQGFMFYELDGGTALLTVGRLLPERNRREELSWIDSQGKVLRRAEATLGEASPNYDANLARTTALVIPSPLALAVASAVAMPIDYRTSGLAPDYFTALRHSLAVFWPPLLMVVLLSVALAWYCWNRHARYYQPYGAVWIVFVLLTGVPGLVGYLFHRRWPVLETCPACKQQIPRDRETCAKCGAEAPKPELNGCEVFA